MSTRIEVLYRAEHNENVIELIRRGGRLVLSTTVRKDGDLLSTAISTVDPWHTPTPRIPARPS